MNLTEHINALNNAAMGSEIRAPLVKTFRMLYEIGKNAECLVDIDGNKYVAEGLGKNGEIELKLRGEYSRIIPPDDIPTAGSTKLVTSRGIYSMIGDLESLRGLLPNA